MANMARQAMRRDCLTVLADRGYGPLRKEMHREVRASFKRVRHVIRHGLASTRAQLGSRSGAEGKNCPRLPALLRADEAFGDYLDCGDARQVAEESRRISSTASA